MMRNRLATARLATKALKPHPQAARLSPFACQRPMVIKKDGAMSLKDPSTLPYRPCVGIVLLNADGLIWLGRRIGELGRAGTRTPLANAPGRHRRGRRPQGRRTAASFTRRPASAAWRFSPKRRTGFITTFRPRPSALRSRENIADSARNGSRCASPAPSRKSIFSPPATNRSSMRGAGPGASEVLELIVDFKRSRLRSRAGRVCTSREALTKA